MDTPICSVRLLICPGNLAPSPLSFFLTLSCYCPNSFPFFFFRFANVCSYLISSQRSSLRPTLEDFDRTRSFHISEDQFLRVLTIFQLLSPGDKDAALLIKVHI